MVRIEVWRERAIEFELEFSVPSSTVRLWRDSDTNLLATESDPGLWKASVVELVKFDLTHRVTTVVLVDGRQQDFDTPPRAVRLILAGGSEEVFMPASPRQPPQTLQLLLEPASTARSLPSATTALGL